MFGRCQRCVRTVCPNERVTNGIERAAAVQLNMRSVRCICVCRRVCANVCLCVTTHAYLLHRLAHDDLIRVVVLERERVVRRLALVLDLVDPRVEVLRGAGRGERPRRRATGSGGGSAEHGGRDGRSLKDPEEIVQWCVLAGGDVSGCKRGYESYQQHNGTSSPAAPL